MTQLVTVTAVIALLAFAGAALADGMEPQAPSGTFAVGQVQSISRDESGQLTSFVLVTHETTVWPYYQEIEIPVTSDTTFMLGRDSGSWSDLQPGARVVAHLSCDTSSGLSEASSVRIISTGAPPLYCVANPPPMMMPEYQPWNYGEPEAPYYPPEEHYRPYRMY